jgi:hypothetical protein
MPQNPFVHFSSFLWSVADHVATLAAGCTVTVVLGLVQKYRKKPLPWKADIAIFLVFLFFACFQGWRDQYDKANEFQVRLSNSATPILAGEFGFALAPAGKSDEDTLGTINATVRDTGAPSVIGDWSASFVFDDKTVVSGKLLMAPAGSADVTLYQSSGPPIVFRGLDHITRACLRQPIPTGGACSGWIQFIFRGIAADQIEEKTTVVAFFQGCKSKILVNIRNC